MGRLPDEVRTVSGLVDFVASLPSSLPRDLLSARPSGWVRQRVPVKSPLLLVPDGSALRVVRQRSFQPGQVGVALFVDRADNGRALPSWALVLVSDSGLVAVDTAAGHEVPSGLLSKARDREAVVARAAAAADPEQ